MIVNEVQAQNPKTIKLDEGAAKEEATVNVWDITWALDELLK